MTMTVVVGDCDVEGYYDDDCAAAGCGMCVISPAWPPRLGVCSG